MIEISSVDKCEMNARGILHRQSEFCCHCCISVSERLLKTKAWVLCKWGRLSVAPVKMKMCWTVLGSAKCAGKVSGGRHERCLGRIEQGSGENIYIYT